MVLYRVFGCLMALLLMPAAAMAITIETLRCEHRESPIGIDTPRPRFTWQMRSDIRGDAQTAYQILVASRGELLDADRGDVWDSGKVASSQSVLVEYDGEALRSSGQYFWKVRVWDRRGRASAWSEPAQFTMGLLRQEDWHARWIYAKPDNEALQSHPAIMQWPAIVWAKHPPAYMRRTFRREQPVARAVLHAAARGLYELRLNGERIGDAQLAPEWTSYHKRVQYQSYDVTEQVRQGQNVLAVILAEGWYAGDVPPYAKNATWGEHPQLLLQLELVGADASVQVIASDDTWRWSINGPIRMSAIYWGELYDARMKLDGWDQPGFDDGDWRKVAVEETLGDAVICAQPNEPIRAMDEVKPVSVVERKPGVHIVDFGRNLVGWVRLSGRWPRDTEIRIDYAEALTLDGDLDLRTLRDAAPQHTTYIARGSEAETHESHFTYHGFRYVRISGLPTPPDESTLTAIAVHGSSPVVGQIETSDADVNRLAQIVQWGFEGNLRSVVLDCSQRYERLGWLGDGSIVSQSMIFNMDMAAFYTKWMRDITDDQNEAGGFPDFSPIHPHSPPRYWFSPGWGNGALLIAWNQYVNYGDRRFLEVHYPAFRRYVDAIPEVYGLRIIHKARGNGWGDWLAIRRASYAVFATAQLTYSTTLAARMARVLGHEDDAKRYEAQAQRMREAFNRELVCEDGVVGSGTQSDYALALQFDMLPENRRAQAISHLLRQVEAAKNHVTTGIHTSHHLLAVLTEAGHKDVAYRVLLNAEAPGWMYMVASDATTMWESWNAFSQETGARAGGGNSLNHPALGAVNEWLWRSMVGLNPDPNAPGYEHVVIRPRPGGGLTFARGTYRSIRGPIACGWERESDVLVVHVSLPVGSRATVWVPAEEVARVQESGVPATQAAGVQFVGMESGSAVFAVESGTYQFVVDAG